MFIKLQDLGKKYNRQWIFRHLHLEIENGMRLAITGRNGSGKSTLLKIIGGYVSPSEGSISYGGVSKDNYQLKFGMVAPYLNLIEELTLMEHLEFHQKFKRPLVSFDQICTVSGLAGSEHKVINEFSSGMKQRLRLSLAFFYESDTILLDEPAANLDEEGAKWYNELISTHHKNRTIIVASNHREEYDFCTQVLKVEDFK